MNLWQKPIDVISFDDVDAFCSAGWEESVRLDYKAEFPKDLAKTIAAMANTVGGMIIIGVDADTTTNKAIWPPVPPDGQRKGLRLTDGLSERVYQVCRDAIFPPIMPEVSQVIENKLLSGHAILVVRIPESKDAPHATEGKKSVYIHERTGNQGYAHSLADIDYIGRLFNRRQRIETERENLITAAIERARTRIGLSGCPYTWTSVIPFYPWRPIATPTACHQFHVENWSSTLIVQGCNRHQHQRVPNGSFGTYFGSAADRTLFPIGCSSYTDKGHVFGIAAELVGWTSISRPESIKYHVVKSLLINVIKGAMHFYSTVELERPTYIQISLGILDARNLELNTGGRNWIDDHPPQFPDDSFRTDATVLHFDATPEQLAKPLLDEFLFAFDADAQ